MANARGRSTVSSLRMSAEETAPAPARASHDSDIPANLEQFLLSGWKAFDPAPPPPVANAAAFAERRSRLGARFPGEHLFIGTGHEKVRANDTHYAFRPGSDFAWLTGNHEADCVLWLCPQADGSHRSVLFVEPVNRTDITFFKDRNKGELWVGRRLGLEHTPPRFGVDEARSLRELDEVVRGLPDARILPGIDPQLEALRPSTERDAELGAAAAELRLLKDAAELAELQTVIDATKRGFEDVIRALPTATSERDVEVIFYGRARREGNDVGYGTIAACGANACILHWTRNHAPLGKGELLLLDAGVEGHALYTADITRTLPVSGKFSPAQREIYELVWEAQQAAMAMVRPGIDFMAPNKEAMRVLARGLERLGILPNAEEALQQENQFYRRYSLHNISHMLGIDVHDCAKARQETYRYGKLLPGMVFTVEPGLYFQPDDQTVPAKYRGIGVRIEDDIVVTEDGYHNLSAHIPSEAGAVEQWIGSVQGAAR